MAGSRGLRLGRLQQVILSVLWEEEMYGLEIQRAIRIYGFKATSGQLYPALKRLEDNGIISSHEETRIGANRIYYSITPKGKKLLIDSVLDQVKILEIIAAKNLSRSLVESGFVHVKSGDVVVEFSNLKFKEFTMHAASGTAPTGRYIIVSKDRRETSLLTDWTENEDLGGLIQVVEEDERSIPVPDDSADVVLILLRLHLDGSEWILGEAKRIVRDSGKVVIFDLLDMGQDFRNDFYSGILPDHSRVGVKVSELISSLERNGLKMTRENIDRGLVYMAAEPSGC
jgi:PadR family transcriptional regulator PadR